jgi:hypothetical protein
MAPKAAKEAAKKKAAKQKKILIGLGLVLVVALVYAVMTLSSLNKSPSAPAAQPAATTPAASDTADISAPAVTPGIVAAPAGTLRAFTALGRKDPFHDDGPDLTSTTSTTTPTTTTPNPTKNPTKGNASSKPKKTSHPARRAVISVNGKKLTLAVGAKFGRLSGAGSPLFRLVGVSATRAVIAVIGTQLQYTLNLRLRLTLRSPGGPRFTFILERVRTAAPRTARKH